MCARFTSFQFLSIFVRHSVDPWPWLHLHRCEWINCEYEMQPFQFTAERTRAPPFRPSLRCPNKTIQFNYPFGQRWRRRPHTYVLTLLIENEPTHSYGLAKWDHENAALFLIWVPGIGWLEPKSPRRTPNSPSIAWSCWLDCILCECARMPANMPRLKIKIYLLYV